MYIDTPLDSSSVFQNITRELKAQYSERKAASRRYSNTNTKYFKSLIVELNTCSKERKTQIQGIFSRAEKQQKCAQSIEHIIASRKISKNDIKTESKILDIKTCSVKKACSICAANEGKKMLNKLISYFAENPSLIVYPFTFSPRNYTGSTMINRVTSAHFGTEKIHNNFKEATKVRKCGPSRGSAPSRKAINQLKEGMTACYFSKEFELGDKDKNTVNAHWHGLLFMKPHKSGSHRKTLDYDSFKHFIDWCNGGDKCQVKIGNTKNENKPITYSDLFNSNGEFNNNKIVKLFLEVIKYVTKMPTKDQEDNFSLRQELIWEVTAATYRYNFVKQGGQLVKYKPPQKIEFFNPHKLKHHGLVFERNSYSEYINDIDDKYATYCYYQLIRLEHVRYKKDLLKDRIHLIESTRKIKNALTQIKAYETEIQKLKAVIQYHSEVKRYHNE